MVWKIIRSIIFVVAAILSFITSFDYPDGNGYNPEVIIPPATQENNIHDFYSYISNEAWVFETKLNTNIRRDMDFKRTLLQLIGLTMLGCAIPTYLVKKKKDD